MEINQTSTDKSIDAFGEKLKNSGFKFTFVASGGLSYLSGIFDAPGVSENLIGAHYLCDSDSYARFIGGEVCGSFVSPHMAKSLSTVLKTETHNNNNPNTIVLGVTCAMPTNRILSGGVRVFWNYWLNDTNHAGSLKLTYTDLKGYTRTGRGSIEEKEMQFREIRRGVSQHATQLILGDIGFELNHCKSKKVSN